MDKTLERVLIEAFYRAPGAEPKPTAVACESAELCSRLRQALAARKTRTATASRHDAHFSSSESQ